MSQETAPSPRWAAWVRGYVSIARRISGSRRARDGCLNLGRARGCTLTDLERTHVPLVSTRNSLPRSDPALARRTTMGSEPTAPALRQRSSFFTPHALVSRGDLHRFFQSR